MYVPPPTPLLGQVLSNRWKLGAVVGRGACSDVYEVTDIRGAGRSTENGGAFVAKIAPLPQAAPHQPNDGKKRLTPPVACRAFHIENFLFGEVGSVDEENISLIDFGISSRCDDLESLGYVIVSMLNKSSPKLPWSRSTSIKDGFYTKRNTSLETLCKGCPAGMLQYMKTVRSMAYEETPDYDRLDARSGSTPGAASSAQPDGWTITTRGAASRLAPSSPTAKRRRSEAEAEVSVGGLPVKLRRSSRLSA